MQLKRWQGLLGPEALPCPGTRPLHLRHLANVNFFEVLPHNPTTMSCDSPKRFLNAQFILRLAIPELNPLATSRDNSPLLSMVVEVANLGTARLQGIAYGFILLDISFLMQDFMNIYYSILETY